MSNTTRPRLLATLTIHNEGLSCDHCHGSLVPFQWAVAVSSGDDWEIVCMNCERQALVSSKEAAPCNP